MAAGIVYLVGAGPGDPGLITVRGAWCLEHADVVISDQLVAQSLIEEHAPKTAEVVVRDRHRAGPDQDQLNRLMIERARAGKTVVRLKGGDPFIFGRGGEEAEALAAAGVRFEIVPGVTAGIAVPAYAGIPLTHRGASGAVAFATGHESDAKEQGEVAWEALSQGATTLVLYMSVTRLEDSMRHLMAAGRPADEPAAVIEWGTTSRQRTIGGTIGDIAERARAAGLEPPALTVIGEVVRLSARISWFEPRRRILLLSTKQEAGAEPAVPGVEVERVAPFTIVPRYAAMKEALGRLARYRTLAFTSAHAVEVLTSALAGTGNDARSLFGKKLAAVGGATAERLASWGLTADLVAAGGGRALGAEMVSAGFEGPVLLPRAVGGREELAVELAAAGYEVELVEAYEAVTDAEALARAAAHHRDQPFAAVAFASPRGVAGFLGVLGGVAGLGRALIGAIGETTARALIDAGVSAPLVASRPEVAVMLDELAGALADRPKME